MRVDHLLLRFFGTTISVAGGTFLQLFVPLALAVYFVFQRKAQGVAFCIFFSFEQFLPVATYMADARAQELPLLTVGDSEDVIHDWNYLFTKMGLLQRDTQIAAVVRFIGWIGMIGVTLWLLRRGLGNLPARISANRNAFRRILLPRLPNRTAQRLSCQQIKGWDRSKRVALIEAKNPMCPDKRVRHRAPGLPNTYPPRVFTFI